MVFAVLWPAGAVLAQAPPGEPVASEEPAVNWVDTSHAYATNQAQALTEWMDNYFGDPNYDAERAESFLRLEFEVENDTDKGSDQSIRLRGKLQLPKISQRLNLVFSGEDGELEDEEERSQSDSIGLQYEVGRRGGRSRFDATMSWGSGHLKPGLKFRSEGPIDKVHSYRFVQRLQYEDGEGFFTIPDLDLNRILDEHNVLRWNNRLLWGENSDGVEWRTRLSLRQRLFTESPTPWAVNYFFTVKGVTRPRDYIQNYRLGFLWRRQIYRDYLFLEFEPAFDLRRPEFEDSRSSEWSVVLRLEVMLHRDLARNTGQAED